jgi:two-component system, chemotaxis family, CheB/CheR fusion protein
MQSRDDEPRYESAELKSKLDELARAQRDIEGLLSAADMGILLLDKQLRIKRFTEKAGNILDIAACDEGKHLREFGDHDNFTQDALDVLQTLNAIEFELRGKSGACYLVRMSPYRVGDNIEGVVVAFVSNTPGTGNQKRPGTGRHSSGAEMASALAHEINQPLTAAVTYLNVMRRWLVAGAHEPKDIAALADKASSEILRAGEIIGRLRDFLGRDEAD